MKPCIAVTHIALPTITLSALLLAACGPSIIDGLERTGDHVSFEDFEAAAYREPWLGGVYIVNGDTPIEDIKQLREFFAALYAEGALIVHRAGGQDVVWSSATKRNLTYCVSDAFGARKATVVAAMASATEGWEAVADVDFLHVTTQDGACTGANPSILFDVRPTSGAPYLARAFFPDQSRSSRNVIIDTSAFDAGWPLEGVLLHELGHTLGFRHEHTRPEADACFEDESWRPLTPYDSNSVMHYPQCNGTGPALTMSPADAEGAAALYGAADGSPQPEPEPGPAPVPTGTAHSSDTTGTLASGERHSYPPIAVQPGSLFEVAMTGTGDADLYVRFAAQPTTSQFDCRPYRSGSSESCSLDVPAGVTEVHVMVHGYSAATYRMTASWIE